MRCLGPVAPACPQELALLCLSWVSTALHLQAGRKQNKLFFPLPHLFLRRPFAARLEHEGTSLPCAG